MSIDTYVEAVVSLGCMNTRSGWSLRVAVLDRNEVVERVEGQFFQPRDPKRERCRPFPRQYRDARSKEKERLHSTYSIGSLEQEREVGRAKVLEMCLGKQMQGQMIGKIRRYYNLYRPFCVCGVKRLAMQSIRIDHYQSDLGRVRLLESSD